MVWCASDILSRNAESLSGGTDRVIKCRHKYCPELMQQQWMLLKNRIRVPKTISHICSLYPEKCGMTSKNGFTSAIIHSSPWMTEPQDCHPTWCSSSQGTNKIRPSVILCTLHLFVLHQNMWDDFQEKGLRSTIINHHHMNDTGHSHKTTPPSAVREHASKMVSENSQINTARITCYC